MYGLWEEKETLKPRTFCLIYSLMYRNGRLSREEGSISKRPSSSLLLLCCLFRANSSVSSIPILELRRSTLSPWTLSLLDVSWWLSLHSSSKLFSYQTSFALFLQERRHRLFSSQEGFHLTILKSLTGEFTFAVIPFLVNCISLWFPIFLFKWNLLLEFCCQVKSVTKSLRSRRVSCMTQSSLLR